MSVLALPSYLAWVKSGALFPTSWRWMVVVMPNGHLKYSTSKRYSEHGVPDGQRWAGTVTNHQWGPWEFASGHICAHIVSGVSTLQVGGRTPRAVSTLVGLTMNYEEAEIAACGQQWAWRKQRSSHDDHFIHSVSIYEVPSSLDDRYSLSSKPSCWSARSSYLSLCSSKSCDSFGCPPAPHRAFSLHLSFAKGWPLTHYKHRSGQALWWSLVSHW